MKIKMIKYDKNQIEVELKVDPKYHHTSQIEDFASKILNYFPDIVKHNCVNEEGLSFYEELQQTQTAHVFEHAVMEKLIQLDRNLCDLEAWTSWNWQYSEKFVYFIKFNYSNKALFKRALGQTLKIFNKILEKPKTDFSDLEFLPVD